MERLTQINRILFDARQRYSEREARTGKKAGLAEGEFKGESNPAPDLKRMVSEANRYVVGLNTEFSIETHAETKRTVVKLVDIITDEVIKEFPPEEMLDVLAGLWEQAGILVDRTE